MRLKPEKIEQLADLVYAALATHPEVKLAETADKIKHAIRKVIHDDLAAEDALEEEARALLDPHTNDLSRKSVSYDQMLLKIKNKLARERKMVL